MSHTLSVYLEFEYMKSIIKIVRNQYKLDIGGIHGISHWERVEKTGLLLAEKTQADEKVIRHFAYLHDSKRWDEDADIAHGKRSAEFVDELFKNNMLDMADKQFEQLRYACYYHNESGRNNTTDSTIQVCWDSDRLDLWRIGVTPNPDYLYTEASKDLMTVSFSTMVIRRDAVVRPRS